MSVEAHLVGSINLPSADDVFRSVGAAMGAAAPRIPDGETGDRLAWTTWQLEVLREPPLLEEAPPAVVAGIERPRYRLRPGVAADEVVFGDLGYAEVARRSYAHFARVRDESGIAPGARFQVSLPTPAAVLLAFVDPADQLALEGPYERALLAEVEAMVAAIGAEHLAIQWDAPAEVGIVEGVFPAYDGTRERLDGAIARLGRLGDAVPAGVQLGYHLCYGDTGDVDDPEGSHWKDPEDLAVLTTMMNRVTAACSRPVDFFHVPVPIRRDDEAYFAPLAQLRLDPGTTLFLGLLHREDGVEGARRRIAAARPFVAEFGVATECGMGRERRGDVPGLLELHATVAAEVAAAA